MATEVAATLAELGIARVHATGAAANEHFVTFNKILDLNYEMDRKITSLRDSLGVREVTSKAGHYGIPLAGTNPTPAP